MPGRPPRFIHPSRITSPLRQHDGAGVEHCGFPLTVPLRFSRITVLEQRRSEIGLRRNASSSSSSPCYGGARCSRSGVSVNGPQASTIGEWLALADQHEAATRAIYGAPTAWGQCIFHLGLTVECLMKARIMQRGRFNTWPSRSMRRDLYTHDLRTLAAMADMPTDPLDAIAPALHIVLQWDRNQGYEHRPPRRPVVDGFMEAAFGPDGVATWLRRTLP